MGLAGQCLVNQRQTAEEGRQWLESLGRALETGEDQEQQAD